MRKFSVTIQNRRLCSVEHYLVEAETPAAAEEILQRCAGRKVGDDIYWGDADSQRYRDAWRDGLVVVLRDRKLPEGVE